MTVDAEWALTSQNVEYFFTMEGAGWPVNGLGGALSGGFDGVVWATADLNSDLATQLGCTVYTGLHLPSSIADKINPLTAEYKPGGMGIKITDHDDWWLQNLTPRKTPTKSTDLETALEYADTTVRLTDGTSFVENDIVWVGGREAIKLGVKALIGGTVYSYTGSSRGYLGTRRGSSLRRISDYAWGYWPVSTSVQDISPFWWDRRVAFWAHVPGEAPANCQLLWYGKLRGIKNPGAGIDFEVSCVADFISSYERTWKPSEWTASSEFFNTIEAQILATVEAALGEAGVVGSLVSATELTGDSTQVVIFNKPAAEDLGGEDNTNTYALALAYHYRGTAGGLSGMKTEWDAGSVQAVNIGGNADVLHSYARIGDVILKLLFRNGSEDPTSVVAELVSSFGSHSDTLQELGHAGTSQFLYGKGTKARFLLDNMTPTTAYNRFAISGKNGLTIPRNVVNLLLIFLTSMDREFWKADATGGTASAITFASTATNDFWAGKYLFRMEGTGIGESRKITNCDGTTITVETAFSAVPAAGNEFQIRNSLYDVLPFGWGIGIDESDIDIDAFEEMRDGPLRGYRIDEFILGTDDEIDILELLKENICVPYGIQLYFDYSVRKISCRYVGHATTDGVIEDYTQVAREDIIDIGSIDHHFTKPVGSIDLKVRAVNSKIVGLKVYPSTTRPAEEIRKDISSHFDGDLFTARVRTTEVANAFSENWLDHITITALFNTENNYKRLLGRLLGLSGLYSIPPPVWTPKLDIALYSSLSPGGYVVINWNTPDAPVNPYTGQRGWTNVIGRVLERKLPLSSDEIGFECAVELLATQAIGKIAPAAVVTAKGADGLGAYFEVEDRNFASDDTDKDYYHFAVGDLLDFRNEDGATTAAGAAWVIRAITGFGTTKVADPTLAIGSPMRVYVDGGIAPNVTANDYITFAAWSASNTSRMETYSAYADGTTELLTGGDAARRYA